MTRDLERSRQDRNVFAQMCGLTNFSALSSERGWEIFQSADESAARGGSDRKIQSQGLSQTKEVGSHGAFAQPAPGVDSKDNCAVAFRRIGGTRERNDAWTARRELPDCRGPLFGPDESQCTRRSAGSVPAATRRG